MKDKFFAFLPLDLHQNSVQNVWAILLEKWGTWWTFQMFSVGWEEREETSEEVVRGGLSFSIEIEGERGYLPRMGAPGGCLWGGRGPNLIFLGLKFPPWEISNKNNSKDLGCTPV